MSNSEDKNLLIALARELAELMGGNPSRLYQWGKDLELPVPRARQTFYTYLESDGWAMESEPALIETCRMGSYPMSCQLRLRVVSLGTHFSRDMRAGKKRQLIVLLGYEVCSHLIHFRVYRGRDVDVQEHEEKEGIEGCTVLPVATVAAFVQECGRMVGLPLEQIFLTQNLMDFQPVTDKSTFLSLSEGKVIFRNLSDEGGDNEVLCSVGSKLPYRMLEGDHPFIDWCSKTNAAKLTADLSDLVKRHNKANALPRLETARAALDTLLGKFHDAAEKRRGLSRWNKKEVPETPFETRLKKHDYALDPYTLHEVRFFRRQYENFKKIPGDSAPVAE